MTFDFGNNLLLPFQIKQMREVVVKKDELAHNGTIRQFIHTPVQLYEHRVLIVTFVNEVYNESLLNGCDNSDSRHNNRYTCARPMEPIRQ